MTRRRTVMALGAVAAAALWVLAATRLARTQVPDDLVTPHLDAARAVGGHALRRADAYARFVRLDTIGARLALLVALGLYARRGARFARESAAGRIGTGFLLGMLGLAFVWLAQVPFGAAALWWERRHGLSHLSYAEWVISDWLGLGGQFLFLCLVLLVVMWLAGVVRRLWWVPATAAYVALGAGLAFAGPHLIPDLHALRAPALAADARRLARAEGVGAVGFSVQDVHRVTRQPNAEATGLGATRRVVLWDTLVDRYPRRDVRVVLAHELGHLQRHHIAKELGWLGLLGLPTALAVALVTRRRGGLADPAAVPLALLVVVVAQLVTGPVQVAASRRYEAEADWVALRTTRDPASARDLFRRFTTQSLADPDPPGWWNVLFANHPSGLERIAMADAWQAAARRARVGSPPP